MHNSETQLVHLWVCTLVGHRIELSRLSTTAFSMASAVDVCFRVTKENVQRQIKRPVVDFFHISCGDLFGGKNVATNFLLPVGLLPIPYCLLLPAYHLSPVAYRILPISHRLAPIGSVNCISPIADRYRVLPIQAQPFFCPFVFAFTKLE